MIGSKPEIRQGTPLQRYVAPSMAAPALWRLFASLALVLIGSVLLTGIVIGFLALFSGLSASTTETFLGFGTPAATLFTLAIFLTWRPAIYLAIQVFGHGGYRTLFGPSERMNWRNFFAGLLIAALIALLSTGAAWTIVGAPTRTDASLMPWLWFAAIAIPLIYIQSSAEELLFRGMILQHMAIRFGAFWAWGLVPSVLFGLLHWNPDGYGAAAWMVLLVTGLTGLTFALVTAATGDLGLAMGLHFGLNVYALLLVAPNVAFSALALSHWPVEDEMLMRLLMIDLASLVVACAGAAWWYRRSQQV